MRSKEREAGGAFYQLHGRRVPRVHLDRVGHAVPGDEIDAVEPLQAERRGHGIRERHGTPIQLCLPHEQHCLAGREQAAAIAEALRSERSVADQLACEAERHRPAAVGDEDDRARQAGDPLLEVRAARHRLSAAPRSRAVPTARPSRLEQPPASVERRRRRARAGDRHGDPGGRERPSERQRVADARENLGWVPQQASPTREQRDGGGMVFEVGGVRRPARRSPRRPPERPSRRRMGARPSRRSGTTSATARRSTSPKASTTVTR